LHHLLILLPTLLRFIQNKTKASSFSLFFHFFVFRSIRKELFEKRKDRGTLVIIISDDDDDSLKEEGVHSLLEV